MQRAHIWGHNTNLNKCQRIRIQTDHTGSIIFGTKFVMKEQKASNTKDSFREEKQDWDTFPTRYQNVFKVTII